MSSIPSRTETNESLPFSFPLNLTKCLCGGGLSRAGERERQRKRESESEREKTEKKTKARAKQKKTRQNNKTNHTTKNHTTPHSKTQKRYERKRNENQTKNNQIPQTYRVQGDRRPSRHPHRKVGVWDENQEVQRHVEQLGPHATVCEERIAAVEQARDHVAVRKGIGGLVMPPRRAVTAGQCYEGGVAGGRGEEDQ